MGFEETVSSAFSRVPESHTKNLAERVPLDKILPWDLVQAIRLFANPIKTAEGLLKQLGLPIGEPNPQKPHDIGYKVVLDNGKLYLERKVTRCVLGICRTY